MKKFANYLFFSFALFSLFLVGSGCNQEKTSFLSAEKALIDGPSGEVQAVVNLATGTSDVATSTSVVGGDRDEHGCIGSAGYSWCESSAKCLRIWEDDCLATSTILYSTEKTIKFCDGEKMDSEGYRKTITKEKNVSLPTAAAVTPRLIKAVIEQSTDGMCKAALKDLAFKVMDGTVFIPEIDAWAGMSIVMCSCKPMVEENIQRIPGVDKIVWE